jgi:hypothetical protein
MNRAAKLRNSIHPVKYIPLPEQGRRGREIIKLKQNEDQQTR